VTWLEMKQWRCSAPNLAVLAHECGSPPSHTPLYPHILISTQTPIITTGQAGHVSRLHHLSLIIGVSKLTPATMQLPSSRRDAPHEAESCVCQPSLERPIRPGDKNTTFGPFVEAPWQIRSHTCSVHTSFKMARLPAFFSVNIQHEIHHASQCDASDTETRQTEWLR
jgi:hypothetical protein